MIKKEAVRKIKATNLLLAVTPRPKLAYKIPKFIWMTKKTLEQRMGI